MYNLIRTEDVSRNVPARYNIAPTQDVLFVTQDNGQQVLMEGRWWLVPAWADEISKYPMFNARSETAHEKSSYRHAMKYRRCLIPADGYYEWVKNAEDGKKDPWCITLPDWEPFSFAGLWAHNTKLGITSCIILTAPADAAIESIHHRMPIILDHDAYDAWLNQDTSVDDARALLKRHRARELQTFRVGRAVGSSRVEGAHFVEPLVDRTTHH